MMASQPAKPVYCDYNATSPLRASARAAMVAAMDDVGNASSIHGFGRGVRKQIEAARRSICTNLSLADYRLTFTSGASEGLAMLLTSASQSLETSRSATHLLIAASDHVAGLQGHGFDSAATQVLPVDEQGLVDLAALESALAGLPEDAQALVCIHGANNETGVIQPVEAITVLCERYQALFVCDLVQWVGRLPLGNARPHALVVSAHKVGGPAGIGAILYDHRRLHMMRPLIRGGGQEKGLRAGTENAIGIVGFAAALHEAVATMQDEQARLAGLRDDFEKRLLHKHGDAVIFGRGSPRLSGTSCFALPGHEAALALMQLDLDGIAVSSGSACSSGKVKASHVLAAMGVPDDLADCALRASFGFASEPADTDRLLASIARWTGAASEAADKNSGKNAILAQSAIGHPA
jgi:cysteine desulfurase